MPKKKKKIKHSPTPFPGSKPTRSAKPTPCTSHRGGTELFFRRWCRGWTLVVLPSGRSVTYESEAFYPPPPPFDSFSLSLSLSLPHAPPDRIRVRRTGRNVTGKAAVQSRGQQSTRKLAFCAFVIISRVPNSTHPHRSPAWVGRAPTRFVCSSFVLPPFFLPQILRPPPPLAFCSSFLLPPFGSCTRGTR